MTILFDKIIHEHDYAHPLSVEPCGDFIALTQLDGSGEYHHCILVERRDKQALIDALMKA